MGDAEDVPLEEESVDREALLLLWLYLQGSVSIVEAPQ